MEEDILRAVGRIAGRQYRECYRDLCAMVEAAIPCMPGTFALEGLYPAVQAAAGRLSEVLAKSVSRAAEDIWVNGDREELRRLLNHTPRYKPAPKELIQALALSVWQGRRACGERVYYQLVESRYPSRFGVLGRSAETCVLVLLLCNSDRQEAESLVRRLNQEQIPLRNVGERLLHDKELLPS